MGGMAVLEWPLCSPPGYVCHVIPLATSARHSVWCISWGEAQRQRIYSDPGYEDGYYTTQPASGLAAVRMSALLTTVRVTRLRASLAVNRRTRL
jgi:homoserine O-acetyltransferase